MASLSVSTEVNNNNNNNDKNDEIRVPVGIQAATGRLRILHRVPARLRENKNHIYDPVVLSLGPYHRNLRSEQFLQVEEFKNEILNTTLDPSTKWFFYSKILERVDEIKTFYVGLSIDEYRDEELAEMMLLDACFIFYYMEATVGDDKKQTYLFDRLGLSVALYLYRDCSMLENHIPFWVIRLLIALKFDDKDEGEAFLCKFLSSTCFGNRERLERLPWEDKDQEPLHLLEASREAFIVIGDTRRDIKDIKHRRKIFKLIDRWAKRGNCISQSNTNSEMANRMLRSVTDLKAKGIHFRPSSYCVEDIRFYSSVFYGKLLLPIWFVDNNTNAFFSNLIIFEMSPETGTDFGVLSYVNFMKSLLETTNDVKELREKGILLSSFRNDEEVLKIFKEIDIQEVTNEDIFLEVKMRISKYLDSKVKMWMAELIHTRAKMWMTELIHTYFRSPWTVIALFSGIFLLCLTFLQTYYTMNPKKSN